MLNKQDFLYDKRLVERFITRGVVTRKEYEQHLSKLPDVATKSQPLAPEDTDEGEAERG